MIATKKRKSFKRKFIAACD